MDTMNRFFRQHNRIARSYQMMREVEIQAAQQAAENGDQIPLLNMVFRQDRHSDSRCFNKPKGTK
jgi:hypothetical protein